MLMIMKKGSRIIIANKEQQISNIRLKKSKKGLSSYVKSILSASSVAGATESAVRIFKSFSSVEAAEMSSSKITHPPLCR